MPLVAFIDRKGNPKLTDLFGSPLTNDCGVVAIIHRANIVNILEAEIAWNYDNKSSVVSLNYTSLPENYDIYVILHNQRISVGKFSYLDNNQDKI